MPVISREKTLDSTLALLTEGYTYIQDVASNCSRMSLKPV